MSACVFNATASSSTILMTLAYIDAAKRRYFNLLLFVCLLGNRVAKTHAIA